MFAHIRANLWLLGLTLVMCAVVYPLALLGIGQALFADQAQGSLILGKDGKPIGSLLIAQPFTGDEYFQPRPSAASYNGAASGATNWGANNYLLRNRVARQLGPIVKYGKGAEVSGKKPGEGIQADLEAWFQKQPGIVAQWAELHAGLAETWIKDAGTAVKDQWKEGAKDVDVNEAFVKQWRADFPESFQAWQQPAGATPSTGDLVKPFFDTFASKYPGEWPTVAEYEVPARDKGDKPEQKKRLTRTNKGSDIQSVFFDMWRQADPDVPLEQVPADMVTASASGLDPHITLANAHYQLDRVAAAWAAKTRREPADVHMKIEQILARNKTAPLGGLVGVDMVNVLEVNLALRDAFGSTNPTR